MTNENDQRQSDADETVRLYVKFPEGWSARVKHGWDKEYCYAQNPDEEYFHLLLDGEIYLERDNEKYCLNCALRREIITRDRLHWQHRQKTEQNDSL